MAKSSKSDQSTPYPWYKVPELWISLIITIAVIAGLIHMIYISAQYDEPAPAQVQQHSKELKSWRGTPFERDNMEIQAQKKEAQQQGENKQEVIESAP